MTHSLAAAATLCAVLSGCASLNSQVAPRVAKAVKAYCLEPQESRTLIRAQVNQITAPNSVKVTCEGDVE
jgi:hypothetical protein